MTRSETPVRIVVADDHPMIRTALEALLRDTDYEIVGTAGTGDAGLREVERLAPLWGQYFRDDETSAPAVSESTETSHEPQPTP